MLIVRRHARRLAVPNVQHQIVFKHSVRSIGASIVSRIHRALMTTLRFLHGRVGSRMTGIPFDLPSFELAYPGPLRDQLVAAVLSGAKTSTSSLLAEYTGEDDPLPVAGQRYVLIDSDARAVGLVEVTEVRTLPLNEVDLEFAREEGEGYESVAAWRLAHERFWKTNAPGITLDDSTVVVAERFRLVERL